MTRMTGSGRIPWLAWSGTSQLTNWVATTRRPRATVRGLSIFHILEDMPRVGSSGSPSVGPMRIVVLALSAWLELVSRLRHGEACAQHRSVPVGSSRLHPRVHKLFC